jgi:hypothetical protein
MIISIDNLRAGLHWWQEGAWSKDILNAEYYAIYDARAKGITELWWTATVDRLGQWRAYRGPTPPNTRAAITARGASCLSEIGTYYAGLLKASAIEPGIADLCWEDVAPLFALVSGIKPKSPVFAGKMCHFVFPRVFIVMDNLATSVFDYEFYWRGMRDEWRRFKERAEATKLLTEAIKSDKPLHTFCPFETKIMEVCHIGYKHPRAV